MSSVVHINELNSALDVRFFLNKTTIIYGQSGSGKTQVLIRLLRLLKETKWFTHTNLWALEDTIHGAGYDIVFGTDNCRSDFEEFGAWYQTLSEDLDKLTKSRQAMLNNLQFFSTLHKFLNRATIQKTEAKIKSFNDALTEHTIMTIWRKAIMDSCDEINENHRPYCTGAKCSVCFFCTPRNTLILLDDFGNHKNDVMGSNFVRAPTLSRHLNITIILLAQSVDLVLPPFRANANINIFTSTATLSQYFGGGALFVSLKKRQYITELFGQAKKINQWTSLVWSNVPNMTELSLITVIIQSISFKFP